MRIYDREGFPNPSRIRMVLAAKGIDSQIDYVSVDLIGAEHKQPEFLAINPLGKIPLLELDNGTLLSESTAITEYLDNLDGDPVLTGKTPLERGVIQMMQKRAETMLMDGVDSYFHYGTPGLGAALEIYKSPEWKGRKEWADREGAKAIDGMRYFDGVLKGSPFVAGSSFSMADITVYAALNFAAAAGLAMPEECVALAAWHARVSDLPAVKNRTGQNFLPVDLKRMGF